MARNILSYFVLGLSTVAFPLAAQVSTEIRERLGSNGVTKAGEWIYASASGLQRGTREGTEEFLATKAMRSIAHTLCNFEPNPSARLEAEVSGFSLVSSEMRGQEILVTMRAPNQNPSCRVVPASPRIDAVPRRTDESPGAIPPKPSRPEQIDETEKSTILVEPGHIKSKDTTIRIFGGEY
jgi:hypothetical protein